MGEVCQWPASVRVDSLLLRDGLRSLYGNGRAWNRHIRPEPRAQRILRGANQLRSPRRHLLHQIRSQSDQRSGRFFIGLLECLPHSRLGILNEGIHLLAEFFQAAARIFLRLAAQDIQNRFHQFSGAPLKLSEALLNCGAGNRRRPGRGGDRRRHNRGSWNRWRGVDSYHVSSSGSWRQWWNRGGRNDRRGRHNRRRGRCRWRPWSGNRRARARHGSGRGPGRSIISLRCSRLRHGLGDCFPIRRRVGHTPEVLRFDELHGNLMPGDSRSRIPNLDADAFSRCPRLGAFQGNKHPYQDSIRGANLAPVHVYNRGLCVFPKGRSRTILAGKENRRNVVDPRAPPLDAERVMRLRCVRTRIVFHNATAHPSGDRYLRCRPDSGNSPPGYLNGQSK